VPLRRRPEGRWASYGRDTPEILRTVTVALETGEVQSFAEELSIDCEPRDCEANLIPCAVGDVVAIVDVTIHESSTEAPAGISSGQHVVPKVADTGADMSGETRPRRLEHFFDNARPDEGAGLGLSVCSRTAEQNGGHMVVHSRACIGATVKADSRQGKGLSAPRQRPEEAVAPPHGNETILLVEDERVVREVVARGLRDQGYTVIEATDGEEALALAREHGNKGVDLLFTDVVMPSMSGWVLASRMRAAVPGIKVLYTSGYAEETIGWGRLNDCSVEFIKKHFTPAELARRVRDVLER